MMQQQMAALDDAKRKKIQEQLEKDRKAEE